MRTITASTRAASLVAAALAAGFALVGCAAGTPAAAGDGEPATSTAAAGAFPATVQTAYGQIVMDDKPEKIVVLSSSYIDLLTVLDEPIAAWNTGFEDTAAFTEWYPWLEGGITTEPDATLATADAATSPEAVAALEPDLILSDVWNVDEATYAQLSQIAPTYVGLATDAQTPWQDSLAALATLTGHDPAVVDQVQADLQASYAAAADRLPGLQGASFQVPVYADDQFWLSEYANDTLEAIGMVPGDRQPGKGETGSVEPVSLENLDTLNADVVAFASRPYGEEALAQLYSTLEADPRLAQLPAASSNGALVYLSAGEWTAVNGGTPASIGYFLDQVVPRLEQSALNRSAQL